MPEVQLTELALRGGAEFFFEFFRRPPRIGRIALPQTASVTTLVISRQLVHLLRGLLNRRNRLIRHHRLALADDLQTPDRAYQIRSAQQLDGPVADEGRGVPVNLLADPGADAKLTRSPRTV